MKINNINTYSDLELALMVLLDYFGTGAERKNKLGTRYYEVQKLVNYILDFNMVPKGTSINSEVIRKALNEMAPTSADYENFVNDFIETLEGIL